MSKAKPIAAIAQISHWVGVSRSRRAHSVRSAWRGYANAGDKVYFTMVPFEFQPRTRVIFGAGCVERVGAAARELKFQRALLVADAGLVGPDMSPRVRRSSTPPPSSSIPYHEFGENPDSAMVEAGRAFAERHTRSTASSRSAAAARSTRPRVSTSCSPTAAGLADYRGYGKARTPCCR